MGGGRKTLTLLPAEAKPGQRAGSLSPDNPGKQFAGHLIPRVFCSP
jgi:hypothetical protein